MSFYYDENDTPDSNTYGIVYECDHPLYFECTLFQHKDGRGLAVVQQYFDKIHKTTYWSKLRPGFSDEIYLQPKFPELFNKYAKYPDADGIYPTMFLRPLMKQLGLRPLKREYWETRF